MDFFMTRFFAAPFICFSASLAMHGPASAQDAKARVIAAIEAAGCEVDVSNVDQILDPLNISDEDFRQIGQELVADNLAEVSEFGVFKLTTQNCM
jgi:hypothetical protein